MARRGQPWRPTRRWWAGRVISAVLAAAFVVVWGYVVIGHWRDGHGAGGVRSLGGRHVGGVPVFLLAPALIIVLILMSWVLPNATRRSTLKLGEQLGWAPLGDAAGRLVEGWHSPPFGRGRGRRIRNAVAGAIGPHPAAAFRYQYTTGSGENAETHTFDILALTLPRPLPPMQVGLESLLGVVAPGLSRSEVKLENEQFNRLWRVRAADPGTAVAVLNPRAVERLLQVEPFSWHIEGQSLVGWSPPVRPDALRQRLEAMAAVADQLPGFLLR